MSAAPIGPIIVVGLGQMGGVFAHGLLKLGHPVWPVTRSVDAGELARAVPDPALCLVAVGEKDLDPVLAALPTSWRGRVGLLQNELVPRAWEKHGLSDPTVCVVWFEKKKTVPITPVMESVAAGPSADLLVRALATLDIPARAVPRERLVHELVKKNLYILVANAAGLAVGGTVGELLERHGDLVDSLARDAITIQSRLVGEPLSSPELVAGLRAAFLAEPGHLARGRSAEARVTRALALADAERLDVPALARLAR